MQELPTEKKEDYVTRAILLMHNETMVSTVVETKVPLFFVTIAHLRSRGREPAVAHSEPFSASTTFPC